MAVTATSANVDAREFRPSKSASYINTDELETAFLVKGATVEDDHYLRNAKNTLTIVEPRPPAELPSVSVWKTWVPDCEWNVIVAAYGGCFPYVATLFGAPTGMTIGSKYDGASYDTRAAYLRIKWPSPVVGDHSFGIRLVDQEGNIATVLVQLNIASTNAIWCDAVGGTDSTTAAGTKAEPFQKIDNWYGGVGGTGVAGDQNDTTYSTKHVIFRAGTYVVPVDSGGGNLNVGLNKPRVWHAYQTEVPILDTSVAAIRAASGTSGGPPDGWNMRGFTTSGEDEVNMGNTFQVNMVGDQQSFWDHTIDNYQNGGTSGSDNPAGLYTPDRGTEQYWLYRAGKNIKIVDFSGGTNMTANAGALRWLSLQHYELYNILLVSQNAAAQHVVSLKHDHRNGVTRLVILPNAQAVSSLGALHVLSPSSGDDSLDNEVEYCYVGATAGDAFFVGDGTPNGDYGALSVRRCVIGEGVAGAGNRTTGTLTLGANIVQNSTGAWTNNSAWNPITQESNDVFATSGAVDTSTGALTGSTRTTYLGLKGWEIQ